MYVAKLHIYLHVKNRIMNVVAIESEPSNFELMYQHCNSYVRRDIRFK